MKQRVVLAPNKGRLILQEVLLTPEGKEAKRRELEQRTRITDLRELDCRELFSALWISSEGAMYSPARGQQAHAQFANDYVETNIPQQEKNAYFIQALDRARRLEMAFTPNQPSNMTFLIKKGWIRVTNLWTWEAEEDAITPKAAQIALHVISHCYPKVYDERNKKDVPVSFNNETINMLQLIQLLNKKAMSPISAETEEEPPDEDLLYPVSHKKWFERGEGQYANAKRQVKALSYLKEHLRRLLKGGKR